MNDDLISRQAVLNMKRLFIDEDGVMAYAVPTGNILRLPSVQPTRPAGKWIEVFVETPNDPYSYGFKSHKCSKCEHRPLQISNFCPNCGTEMTELNRVKTELEESEE